MDRELSCEGVHIQIGFNSEVNSKITGFCIKELHATLFIWTPPRNFKAKKSSLTLNLYGFILNSVPRRNKDLAHLSTVSSGSCRSCCDTICSCTQLIKVTFLCSNLHPKMYFFVAITQAYTHRYLVFRVSVIYTYMRYLYIQQSLQINDHNFISVSKLSLQLASKNKKGVNSRAWLVLLMESRDKSWRCSATRGHLCMRRPLTVYKTDRRRQHCGQLDKRNKLLLSAMKANWDHEVTQLTLSFTVSTVAYCT